MKASAYVAGNIGTLIERIRNESQAVVTGMHESALHDLRVCVRRLRAALRTARGLYGQKKTRAIESRLRKVTDETNAMRDAEVTLPVLRSIRLDEASQPGLEAWIEAMQAVADEKSEELAAWLSGDPLAGPLAAVEALMVTPPVAHGGRSAGKHARLLTKKELKRVRKMLKNAAQQTGDAARMHKLRIACKRLRYTAEFYAAILGGKQAAWAKAARKVQRDLGTLHDLDVILEMTQRNEGLPETTREALLAALAERRETQAGKSIKTLNAARKKLRK